MTRLRSDIWVAAYLRRCATENVSAYLRRRGSPRMGAVIVRIDQLDGFSALYSPAPQSEARDGYDRLFARAHREDFLENEKIEAQLMREISSSPISGSSKSKTGKVAIFSIWLDPVRTARRFPLPQSVHACFSRFETTHRRL